jgi:LuxR family transcriptional regulator
LARASLTDAELAVLRAFRDGLGQKETADALGIAESTVKQRAIRACSKLGAHTRTQAVAIAVQRNYFDG